MIHITDFNGDIIDFISKSDGAVTEAEHMINVEDKLETFDFTVLTSRTEHMQKRNRVIIEDKDGQYREFIIYNISSDLNGYTRVQTNASALEDIKTAKPVGPHKLDKHTVKQALEYALADTGWEVSDEAEWGGTRTTSWTGWHDRISILKQLETTYDMRLSFHVEVGSNKITNRYVSLNKVEPMFEGEEIVYGENMIDLKRTVDFSDIATALICLGPEDSETGKREIVEVKDDDAQAQFGLPYRYIWDIYEPQSSDENMTRQRLTTLGRTALNKRKQESISYDIDGIGLSASAGDMIRVKNEDFTPELYVDAEVVEVTTDLISGESEYKFGVIKEYTRDDVYARFNAMLSGLRERLNKVVENTDSIISERLEEELKYVERYIEKSPTPPLNPKEGQLWLDTSHDGVAVLKRYENGEWIKSSVDDVKEIGGMTREETMYEALKERLTRNEVDYSEVFKRHGALVSEKHYHYVDEDTKNDLTNRYNALQQSYDDFKIAFNNINSEQPTIGLITTAISRAIEFEARLKEYNDSYYVARKAFDEVIALLQSQYSDEKHNEAMQELAEQIGGEWNGNELVVDGKVHEKFYDVRNELERQDDLLKNTISETEYISDELSKSQSALEQHSYELNTKVSYTEMNGTNKTLEKLLTEFSQTADGFNFRIDSNGMIQDLTFDRNAFKLNSNLIEFNDGDVVIKDGKTSITQAFIDNLEVTKMKSIDDNSKLRLAGGNLRLEHADGRYTTLSNDGLHAYDSDNRLEFRLDKDFMQTGATGTSTSNMYVGARSGYEVRFVDATQLPSDGLIDSYTYVDARGKFGYFDAFAPNQGTHLWLGADGEVRISNKGFTTYNTLRSAGIYVDFLEQNTLGNNATNFYIRPSGSGEVRFTKAGSTTSYADVRALWIYSPGIRTTTGKDLLLGADREVVAQGVGGVGYRSFRGMDMNLHGHITHNSNGGWFYIGAGRTNGVRFTDNNWSDGGYKNIQFQEFKSWSAESAKTEIEKWDLNVLDVIKDELQLYKYKFKQNVGSEYSKFSHGIILRNNSNEDEFPVEWRDEDAFNGNEVLWWSMKGVQELAHENDELKSEITELKSQINKIMEMIA